MYHDATRSMTIREKEGMDPIYVHNTPMPNVANNLIANGNTEPKVVSESESKNPTSVLNTFIRNHERKKESQRDQQPREN